MSPEEEADKITVYGSDSTSERDVEDDDVDWPPLVEEERNLVDLVHEITAVGLPEQLVPLWLSMDERQVGYYFFI